MGDVRLEDVIGTAIQREVDAYAFYGDLAAMIQDKEAKETILYLQAEEARHREFLETYLKGQLTGTALRMADIVNYKIAEYLDRPDIAGQLDSKDVYLVAAHRELNSFNFYTAMAGVQPEGEIKSVFLRMANEELKHKEKMEYLYSNTAFPQLAGG